MRTHELVEVPQGAGRKVRALRGSFGVNAADSVTTLDIYDVIGIDGISSARVRETLSKTKTPRILVRIDSPGGDVFDGIAIYNDLVRHPASVHVEITGLAASAASVIAMAGDRIEIAESAFVMIHKAWSFALGNEADMIKTAEVLAKVDRSLVSVYARATGQSEDTVIRWMEAETWFSGTEAVQAGLADAVTEAEVLPRVFNLDGFTHVPGPVKRRNERALRSDGATRSEALRGASGALAVAEPESEEDLAAALEALAGRLES